MLAGFSDADAAALAAVAGDAGIAARRTAAVAAAVAATLISHGVVRSETRSGDGFGRR